MYVVLLRLITFRIARYARPVGRRAYISAHKAKSWRIEREREEERVDFSEGKVNKLGFVSLVCYRQCGGCSRHHFRAVDPREFRAAARRQRLRLGYEEPRRWRN